MSDIGSEVLSQSSLSQSQLSEVTERAGRARQPNQRGLPVYMYIYLCVKLINMYKITAHITKDYHPEMQDLLSVFQSQLLFSHNS